MLTNETLGLIIGAILPPVIDLMVKYIKNSNIRFIVSLLICLVAGVLISIDNLTFADILGSGAIVFASAQVIYKTYWKDSGIRTSVYGKAIHQD
jgi:hypothetical protein